MVAGMILRAGKARFACAATGVAAAAAAVVFMFSLAETNRAQAPALAARAAAPWAAWSFAAREGEGRNKLRPSQEAARKGGTQFIASPGAGGQSQEAARKGGTQFIASPGADGQSQKAVRKGGTQFIASPGADGQSQEAVRKGGTQFIASPGADGQSQEAARKGEGRNKLRPSQGAARKGGTQFIASPDLRLDLVQTTLDYRPGGRVLQGPPMRAVIAAAPAENPYGCTALTDGRWPDDAAAAPEVVCTRNTLKRFGRGEPPPVGTSVKFVGENGTVTAVIAGYLAEAKLPPGWPGVFANQAAFAALAGERHGTLALWKDGGRAGRASLPKEADHERASRPKEAAAGWEILTPASESVVAGFTGDEQRRMDYARPLLLIAAALTALCLLVNSLLLSVEANRKTLAALRVAGLTRAGAAGVMAKEALAATAVGFAVGCGAAAAALVVYVAADKAAFPAGSAFAGRATAVAGAVALAVAGAAVLFALRPALSVRPLDAQEARPHRRRRGMAVAFACGFAAFVAVEVWGASLMRAFVPSPEWPDAIVSLLPEGVSSFDIAKLRALPGVKRISELCPLQLNFEPEEPMRMPGGAERGRDKRVPPGGGQGRDARGPSGGGQGRDKRVPPGAPPCRNALFLAAEWLPEFRFVEGTHDVCAKAIAETNGCVIAEMISRARNLHAGDRLRVALGGRGGKTVVELPIVGVVDVNWHMVTSRGLVRGLNRAPGMTDGPVFVSFDTLESLDARPAPTVKMTHLWVEYEPSFLAANGVFPAGRKVEKAIADALGNPPGSTVRLHARDEIADGTLAHGSDVIGQAARVPFVFLAILSIGFVAMLVADADAAKKELAVLRAVGATRAQLAARLAGSALKTAAWGMVCGLPVGALVGWLFALKTGGLWPGLPPYFVVPGRVIAEGACGALAFVLAVALPTALRILGLQFRRTN